MFLRIYTSDSKTIFTIHIYRQKKSSSLDTDKKIHFYYRANS